MLGLGNSLVSSSSIPFHPSDISGLVANFNSSVGITLSSTYVTRWADTTGSYLLVPEDTPLRPTWTSSRGVVFTGNVDVAVADRLELQNAAEDAASITLDTSSSGFCIIVQYASDDWDDGKYILGNHGASEAHSLNHRASSNSFDFTIRDTTKNFALNDPASLTDADYYSIVFNSDNSGATKLFINNTQQSDTETFGNIDFIMNQVGATDNENALTGNVKNIILYDKELSTAELAQIETYLKVFR